MPIDKSPQSVAIFAAYFPSHGGGMELATAEFSRGLVDAGLTVRWLAQGDGPLPSLEFGHCIPLGGTDLIYKLSGVPMPLPSPWGLKKIVSAVRQSDLTIVVEANFIISVLAYAAAKFLSKPIILVQHVGQPSTVSRLARAVMQIGENFAVRPMLAAADEVVFVSDAVASYFDDTRPANKAHVIGHGIDTNLFRLPNNAQERQSERETLGLPRYGKIACFVGRTTESKGILVVRELARTLPDWNFAIAGQGPVQPSKWNLPNVVYLGQLDRAGVASLYRSSDACVLPSQSESFSLVVREAIACGCRVICSEQILDTDSSLSSFLETEEVDLADAIGTAERFAKALQGGPAQDPNVGFHYVKRNCSWHQANRSYKKIVNSLLNRSSRFE